MVPPKLLAYLREKKKAGYPNEMLRAQFANQGWPDTILNEAFSVLDGESNMMNGGTASFIQATNALPFTPMPPLVSSPATTPASTPLTSEKPSVPQAPEPARRPGILRRMFVSTRLRIYFILVLIAVGIIYFLGRVPKDTAEPESIQETQQSAEQSAINTSFDLAVEQVGFTPHKVTTIPEGFAFSTGYEAEVEEETGKTYVRIAMNAKEDPQGTGAPIVVRQSAVSEDFDEAAIDFGEGAEVTPVVLSVAKTGTAHLTVRLLGESTIRSLIFVSPSNMLVEIASTRATDDQILQIAQGLI